MKESVARKNILKKIKQALAQPVPVPFSDNKPTDNIFHQSRQDLELEFAEQFGSLQGRFSFCTDQKELATQLQTLFTTRDWKKIFLKEENLRRLLEASGEKFTYSNDLESCDAAITGCECLVARTGSIMLSAARQSGRTVSVYAPVHVCIAFSDQLVYDIKDALELLQKNHGDKLPSLITFATGPSRTADIEKTLVTGVHGPKEVFCFLVEKPRA
jgi:L-lactate dehydrogenase complex protein LldG